MVGGMKCDKAEGCQRARHCRHPRFVEMPQDEKLLYTQEPVVHLLVVLQVYGMLQRKSLVPYPKRQSETVLCPCGV